MRLPCANPHKLIVIHQVFVYLPEFIQGFNQIAYNEKLRKQAV